jgi:hypothetical protein
MRTQLYTAACLDIDYLVYYMLFAVELLRTSHYTVKVCSNCHMTVIESIIGCTTICTSLVPTMLALYPL